MTASESAAEQTKEIIAIQAFIDDERAQQIMAGIAELPAIEGLKCDLKRGMFPHFTIASWRMTLDETKQVQSQYVQRIGSLRPVSVAVSLTKREMGERVSYHLLPDRPEHLVGFHARIHENLAWSFEPFRKIDLPGSWWPHLTLFGVPIEHAETARELAGHFNTIKEVDIVRLGLVSFGPMRTLAEIRLDANHE